MLNVAKLWHDVGSQIGCPDTENSHSVEEVTSMMYKPLSLVIGKTDRTFEPSSIFDAYARISKDGSRNNTEGAVQQQPAPLPAARPRCIKSYRSDRMAIYDEQRDTFHAYSVTEAISQSGLSFQEAVDWIDDRLVLVGTGMTPGKFSVAMALILASWGIAILLVSLIIKLIF